MVGAPLDCERCPALVDCRKQVVNGHGVAEPLVAFIGQNPDWDEDDQGRPFVGRPGQLLRLLCDSAGIRARDTFRTNAVRCHSPGNRKPTAAEVEECHDYLIEELRELPSVALIVALGETAFDSLYLLPLHRETLREFNATVIPAWEAVCAQRLDEYNQEILLWDLACSDWKANHHKGEAKPKKPARPKLPSKPKPPVKLKMAMAHIVGQTLYQPETGLPLIVSYHPAWLMRNWSKADLVLAHFEKVRRMAYGEQVEGALGEYHVIQTLEELIQLRDHLLSDEVEKIYFDTETTGLNWQKDELLCISLTGRAGEGYVVPILQQGAVPCEWWEGKYPKVIGILKDIFGSQKPKVGQTTLFDVAMLERDASWPFIEAVTAFGIKVNGYLADTELSHQMVAETLPHNMTSVLALSTDMPYYEAEVMTASNGKKQMAKVPNHILWKYSAADADGLPRMEQALDPIIEAEGTTFVLGEIANPLLRLCWNMQKRGVPIDIDYFDKLCRFYNQQIAIVEKRLYESVPDYDWESAAKAAAEKKRKAGKKVSERKTARKPKYLYPPVLQDLLFKHLALPKPDRQTKGGRGCDACSLGICFDHIQTGKDALKDIQAEMGDASPPILQILLDFKALVKIKSTYLDGGRGGWKRFIRPDGRIHPTVQVSRAETGRLAFKTPNLQNPPKGIHIHPKPTICDGKSCPHIYSETFGIDTRNAFRDIIRAPVGRGVMNCDWAQLEVWVMAYMLRDLFGDTTLLDVLEAGQDIHTFAARMMYPELDPELDEWVWRQEHRDLRDKAKVFVFGTDYGLTIIGTMERLHCDEAAAKDMMARYLRAVPALPRYFKYIRQMVTTEYHVKNRFDRRRHTRHVDILRGMGENNEVEGLVRESLNMPIQAGGSDLHSYVSVSTDEYEALRERACETIMSMHDSLAFEFDWPTNDYALETAWVIKRLWEKLVWNMPTPEGEPLHWKVPVELEWGQTWGTPEYRLDSRGNLIDLSKEGS